MLRKIKNKIGFVEVINLLDTGLTSEAAYERIRKETRQGVIKAGLNANLTPLKPLDEIQMLLKQMNLEIIEKHEILPMSELSPGNPGYYGNIDDILTTLVIDGGYSMTLTDDLYDTIMPAFAYDKCPFLHSGRNLFIGHIEDMTKLSYWRLKKVIPEGYKSETNNLLTLACEMKKETYDVFKVSLFVIYCELNNCFYYNIFEYRKCCHLFPRPWRYMKKAWPVERRFVK